MKKSPQKLPQITNEIKALWKEANTARLHSHSPYSRFAVGAALSSTAGKTTKIFQGCNVENASYGATVCAERVAFWKAISEGAKNFDKIMLVIDAPKESIVPCAMCLQVMSEFVKPEFEIWTANPKEILGCFQFRELLPTSFQF